MDLSRIEQMLAKYWEGETTLEEEKELKKFFNSENVPEKWHSVAPLFQYFAAEKRNGHLDGLFDAQLLSQLKSESNQPNSEIKGRIIRMISAAAKVAAVGLILITAGYFVREEYINKKPELDPYITDTFEDPKEAFEETKRALLLISKNFNKGRREVQKVGVFNEAQEKIKDTETL